MAKTLLPFLPLFATASNAAGSLPWALTFSYGRALQEDALNAWEGKAGGFAGGQKALAKRAKLNGLAAAGEYKAAMESAAPEPTFLMASSPKRIWSSCISNLANDLFTSGGRTLIPIRRASSK